MKQYAALLVAAIAAVTFAVLTLTFLLARSYKFAIGSLIVAVFALSIGRYELRELRRTSRLRRPPFTIS
jgi:uncharacterized membrane protein YccC